jgi:hypothetical protein
MNASTTAAGGGMSGTLMGHTARPAISKKQMLQMDFTASSITGVIDNLRTQLAMVEDEIKADVASKAEFEKALKILETRKGDLQTRVDENQKWLTTSNNAYILEQYGKMTSEIGTLYNNAKKGHASGIVLLEKEFGYHPAFKRPKDTFTATAFRPM